MKKNKKGFSLVECMVVIIIIGVLCAIWGFYGKDHMKIAYMNEARMFIEKVVAQEKLYMNKNGDFTATTSSPVEKIDDLFLNAKTTNKYYRTFKIINHTSPSKYLEVQMFPDDKNHPELKDSYVVGRYYPMNDRLVYEEFYGN